MSQNIHSLYAREILDSRGNPTLETTVILDSGYRGTVGIPSGASLGKHEAGELRDGDPKRYGGMGVLKAITNVTTTIAAKIRGMDALEQKTIDQTLLELDGTPDKKNLGGNSVLSVSLAVAFAASNAQRVPFYQYINSLFSSRLQTKMMRIPTPTFNVINGGKHGAGNLNFQEFHIIPASSLPYHKALEIGVEIYQAVKQILTYRNAVHSVGDEGGFAPDLFTNLDAMEVLVQSIRATPYRFGVEVFLGLDVAATHFKTERGYQIKDRPLAYNSKDFIAYLKDLHEKYRLLMLEDPLDEDDWSAWSDITKQLSHDVIIVGDDLLATNAERLQKAIDEKACSGILLKPNQIGTLTEFLDVVALAKKHDLKTNVSHRSGETNDTYIADIAVGIQSDYVKFGAPARGERVAKYNRLLQIEAELFSQ